MRRLNAAALAILSLAISSVIACGEEEYTSTVVVIEADVGVRARAAAIAVQVRRGDGSIVFAGDPVSLQGDDAEAQFPYRLEVVSVSSSEWAVDIELIDRDGVTFRRDSDEGRYSPGETETRVIRFRDRGTQLALGTQFSCVLRDNDLYCFGDDSHGLLGGECPNARCSAPTRMTGFYNSVSAAGDGVCALDTADRLHCWGDVNYDVMETQPTLVPGVAPYRSISFSRNLRCGITLEGELQCSSADVDIRRPGPADQGELSNPLPGVEVVAMDVGVTHVCALDASSALHCWGRHELGTLGRGRDNVSEAPQAFEEMLFTHVSLGAPIGANGGACPDLSTSSTSNTCGIRDGQLLCWGYNSAGMLGEAAAEGECAYVPTIASSDEGWTDVSLGKTHGCGIRDEAVYCWGNNAQGQLGRGPAADEVLGVGAVETPAGEIFVHVDCGDRHSCAATREGAVFCWGIAREGQLGVNPDTAVLGPVRVPLPVN